MVSHHGISPRARGITFTKHEIRAISIAIYILTLVFAFAFSGSSFLGQRFNPIGFLFALPISLVAVLTAFALHELGHKLVSNYFGFPAGFSYSKQGLIFALIISLLFGVAVGLPGAVIIYGRPDKRENGLISAAGPLTNLLVGILFIIPGIVTLILGLRLIGTGLVFVALINFFIGTFNMIPFMPFDGAKIWRWNPFIYLLLLFFLAPPVVFYFIGGF